MKFRVLMLAALMGSGLIAFDGSTTEESLLAEDAAACEFDGCEPCPNSPPPVIETVKEQSTRPLANWMTCPA